MIKTPQETCCFTLLGSNSRGGRRETLGETKQGNRTRRRDRRAGRDRQDKPTPTQTNGSTPPPSRIPPNPNLKLQAADAIQNKERGMPRGICGWHPAPMVGIWPPDWRRAINTKATEPLSMSQPGGPTKARTNWTRARKPTMSNKYSCQGLNHRQLMTVEPAALQPTLHDRLG